MDINAAILREQVTHQHQSPVDHSDEGIRTLAPGVAERDLFQDVPLLGENIVAARDVHREVVAHIKGRVNLAQLGAAPLIKLLALRTVLQR
jgi:hypothetical protein